MLTASSDAAFMKSLTPNENEAFLKVLSIAQSANLRSSLISQKAHNFGTPSKETFAYVMANNAGVKISFSIKAELEYSDDSKKFQLVPGQPERTAVTSSDPAEPIYIHRKLISRPDFQIEYSSAVALAVHEYGNKTGAVRDQNAIDAVAAKIQIFVEQNTRRFETPEGKLSFTVFKKPPFEDLLQHSLTTATVGTLSRLWLTNNEGFYSFYETEKGIFDVSEMATKDLKQTPPSGLTKDSAYDWLKFYWYGGELPKMRPISGNTFEIEMNMEQFSTALPFGKASSPDPLTYRPWLKPKKGTSVKKISHNRITWTLEIADGKISFRDARKSAKVFEDPTVQIEKISSVRDGQEHVLIYKFPTTYKIKGFITAAELAPVLKLRHQGKVLDLWGKKVAGSTDHFEFRIPSPLQNGIVEVVGIEGAGAKDPDMTAMDVLRVKFLLPDSESISFSGANTALAPSTRNIKPFAFKSLQLWDGSKWTSLKDTASQLAKGSHLRFIFDSTTPLRSLDLLQSYVNAMSILAEAPPFRDMNFSEMNEVSDRLIHIPEERLRQTLVGNKLIVDWLVDQDFNLKKTIKGQINPKTFVEMQKNFGGLLYNSQPPGRATQEVTTEVTGPRRINAIEAINGLLENVSHTFANPAEFEKVPSILAAPNLNVKNACARLF